MTAIVPRWEWRTFGQGFDEAEAAFAALATPGGVHESDEIYLLGAEPFASTVIVKIRDGLIDVKILREVSIDGLERWEPILKAGIPATAADLVRIGDILGLDHEVPADGVTTMDAALTWILAGGRHRPIDVHKRRVRYRINGCAAEVTDVAADDRTGTTIAIESEDPDAVNEAIRMIGLEQYVNTNYERALAALMTGQRARHAVIDVGTNSIKFHIAERTDGAWRTVLDRAEMTRLGEGIERDGRISPAALERTVAALRGMVDEARANGATTITAVGTAGLRAATDRDAALDAIRAGAGLTVELISGEEEGRLSQHAVQAEHAADGTLVIFETGGGSSQFTFGRGTHVDERFSLPVGAVGYTERFGLARAVSTARVDEACAAMAADLSSIAGRPRVDVFVGMGGTVTNMAAVAQDLERYDPEIIEGTILQRAEVDRQIERYAAADAAERRTIVGLQPARAEVILAGACIVRTVMDLLGQTSMSISTHGLRHGLLRDRFGA